MLLQILLVFSLGLEPSLSDKNFLNALQLAEIVGGQTKCSFSELLNLLSYGNWCGLGNNGRDPIDSIDACCQQHDFCYDHVIKSGPCVHPGLVTYQWRRQSPRCLDCAGGRGTKFCQCGACTCDFHLAHCLRAADKCPPVRS